MKYEQEIREYLIENTIKLVAEGGFEKATTKAITHNGGELPDIKMNEVYIYRLFDGKEALYHAAFEYLDKELVFALQRNISLFHQFEGSLQERLYELFLLTWRFILKNEAYCRYYVRYYYSSYFHSMSCAGHNRRFEPIVAEASQLFTDDIDVKSILDSLLTTLLDYAIRVFHGVLVNNETNKFQIFNSLYCFAGSYFKDTEEIYRLQ